MDDRIAPALGRETDVQALGRAWTLGRLTMKVWDDLWEWVKARRPDPFAPLERFIDRLSPEAAEKEFARARDEAEDYAAINSPGSRRLLDTLDGRVEQFYLLLRANHPEVTRDTALEILQEIGEKAEEAAKLRAAGEAPAGKAQAPAGKAQAPAGSRPGPAGGGRSRGTGSPGR